MQDELDILEAFLNDVKTLTSDATPSQSISTSAPTFRVKVTNSDRDDWLLNGGSLILTGEVNVQITAPRGYSEYQMRSLTKMFLERYKRPYSFGGVSVDSSKTSPVYQLDAVEAINVLINYITPSR
jgi:hypothetical protein